MAGRATVTMEDDAALYGTADRLLRFQEAERQVLGAIARICSGAIASPTAAETVERLSRSLVLISTAQRGGR